MTSTRPRTEWLLPTASLLLAALQLLLLPLVWGGQSLNFFQLLTLDALSITFGMAWTLALGLLLISKKIRDDAEWAALSWGPVFVSAGLILVAYAGNQAALVVGLVVAGVGVWKSLKRAGNKGGSRILFRNVLGAAAFLIASIALSWKIQVFLPPAGGVPEQWGLLSGIAAALAVMIAAHCWPFHHGKSREAATGGAGVTSLLTFYSLITPAILAKMLVAAPWHPVGIWAMVALGMLALLGGAYLVCLRGGDVGVPAPALTGIAIVGFGLASLSPAAAAGSIWVMLVGLLIVMAESAVGRSNFLQSSQALATLACLPGVWLISQGALDTGYGIVALFLLPTYALVTFWSIRSAGADTGHAPVAILAVGLAAIAVVYPQLPIEWVVKPVVGAMAGGVGALSTGADDWGVGLALRSAQETVLAGLPATDIAVGVFLSAVALYWLKQLLALLVQDDVQDGQLE